jgi:hypothetical protein
MMHVDHSKLSADCSCLRDQSPGGGNCGYTERRKGCKKVSSGMTACIELRVGSPFSTRITDTTHDILACHLNPSSTIPAPKCIAKVTYSTGNVQLPIQKM